MSERLPSESCPFCDCTRPPLLWAIDASERMRRTYRCPDCARTWSVDGTQASLFDLTDPDEAPALRLEVCDS